MREGLYMIEGIMGIVFVIVAITILEKTGDK